MNDIKRQTRKTMAVLDLSSFIPLLCFLVTFGHDISPHIRMEKSARLIMEEARLISKDARLEDERLKMEEIRLMIEAHAGTQETTVKTT